MFVNKLNTTQVIKVLDPNGKPDSINLQPGGRAQLPVGYTVDPAHAGSYRDTVKDTGNDIATAIAAQRAQAQQVSQET
jgi:hypothetical protein